MSASVVVGVDGTGRSLRALMWAAHEASLRNSPLHIMHMLPRWEGDFPLFPPGRFEEAEAQGRDVVDEALALARQAYPGLAVTAEMPMSTPAAALLGASDHAEVVVLGGKGEDVGNALLGSTVLQVVGHARCPVVVVGHPSAGHGRVVVGTDGSADAAAATAYAFEAASLRGDALEVVSALGLPQGWPTHLLRPLPEDTAEVTDRRNQLEREIAPLRQTHPDVEVILNVHRLDPITTLASASHRADLLVLGSRGRGGFHGLAVGSVTHKLLHFTSCPTAVIRSQPA